MTVKDVVLNSYDFRMKREYCGKDKKDYWQSFFFGVFIVLKGDKIIIGRQCNGISGKK